MLTNSTNRDESPNVFPNTSWSLIRQSQDIANPEAVQALDQLARAYWRPLHACVCAMGYTYQDAEDAVQRMFEQLVSRDSLRAVLPGETRFRHPDLQGKPMILSA
jgi:hypothetical protein